MRTGVVRIFWLGAGLFFTALAFLGVALPLLPTTPFLLLAAFCFARSSQKLRDWLYAHKLFGPLLTDWETYGAINRRAKLFAVIALVATPILTYLFGGKLWVVAVQIPILACSAIFILTRPDGPKSIIDEDPET